MYTRKQNTVPGKVMLSEQLSLPASETCTVVENRFKKKTRRQHRAEINDITVTQCGYISLMMSLGTHRLKQQAGTIQENRRR